MPRPPPPLPPSPDPAGRDSGAAPAPDPARTRIVRQARLRFFRDGYGAFTMDDLAADLGMSKKTLYVHFASKRALGRAIIDDVSAEVRREADLVLRDRRLTFIEKLHGFTQGMLDRFNRIGPDVLPELARLAPDLHRHIEEVRGRTIPYVFGRLIEEGQIAGVIRDDVSPVFAAEFHLHAMQGMMHPDTLRRLKLAPSQTFETALRLLFGGLLTPAGHQEYEKRFAP